MIDYFEKKLRWITINEAVILLRHLGSFHTDELLIVRFGLCTRIRPYELLVKCDSNEYAKYVWKIYFRGGPMQAKQYKGTYLTFLIDRCLLVACERGKEFVDNVIAYAKGFGLVNHA